MLAADAQVRLTVYDVRGRSVAVLADRAFGAGEHTVLFDGRDLPSGVYFYRLQADGYDRTLKMIMLK